jgi:hypothetical protein
VSGHQLIADRLFQEWPKIEPAALAAR